MTEKTHDPAAQPADGATVLRQGAAEQLSAALGETRHRSISEAPSPVDRARQQRQAFYQDSLDKAKKGEEVYERLNELVENSVRARMGEPDVEDRIKRDLDHYRQSAERLKKIVAEDD